MVKEAKIKINARFFNSITAVNKYVKTFTFGKNRLYIQINTVENCKKKISIKSIVYIRLAIKFLFNGSWRESKWMEKQFKEVREPLLAIKLIVTNQKNRDKLSFQTITKNWGLLIAQKIKDEFNILICLRYIASVLSYL